MSQQLIKKFTQAALEKKLPDFKVGDKVRVFQKIREGEKERIQPFEGLVIAKRGSKSTDATFTVRRISSGVGVEKIYPLYSPTIVDVKILERPRRRPRSKLYWARHKKEKEIRLRLRLSKHQPDLVSKNKKRAPEKKSPAKQRDKSAKLKDAKK